MRLTALIPVMFFVLIARAQGIPSAFAPSGGDECRAAINAAERGHALPPKLLNAIGRVESGRKDPATGLWGPWPWTINAEGAGAFFDSKADAIAAVTKLRARGVRSIDVGCMQVNLMHHPDAFPTLDQAFDPWVNADYAARFLTDLHAQGGDWMVAVGRYHSSNPSEGEPYAAKVAAIWPEEQRIAAIVPPASAAPGVRGNLNPITLPPSHQPPKMLASVNGSGTAAGTGHGLSFYWSAPVRSVSRPRTVARIPYLAALR